MNAWLGVVLERNRKSGRPDLRFMLRKKPFWRANMSREEAYCALNFSSMNGVNFSSECSYSQFVCER
jgi:hypothetical protein